MQGRKLPRVLGRLGWWILLISEEPSILELGQESEISWLCRLARVLPKLNRPEPDIAGRNWTTLNAGMQDVPAVQRPYLLVAGQS